MFIDTKPQGYSYDTSDETVINQLRSLPERTKKLNSQEAKCFTQIFDKLVATKPEGGGFSGGDAHLSSTEREEFAALINTMDVQHMIHWKKISVMCTPPSMSYTLYNFPVNPVEAVLQVVNYHKSRLASNGATSITIGRVKSSDIKKPLGLTKISLLANYIKYKYSILGGVRKKNLKNLKNRGFTSVAGLDYILDTLND